MICLYAGFGLVLCALNCGHDQFSACNCHSQGSRDPFCRETDGQCSCFENAYGRRCNECQPGYWNFPNCQPCECNGHADICDAFTGECIDCRDWTNGFHCEVCMDGFYGDPKLGINIPCRECPCPNTKASGHSFAEKCFLDSSTDEPTCDCDEGYSGEVFNDSTLSKAHHIVLKQENGALYVLIITTETLKSREVRV